MGPVLQWVLGGDVGPEYNLILPDPVPRKSSRAKPQDHDHADEARHSDSLQQQTVHHVRHRQGESNLGKVKTVFVDHLQRNDGRLDRQLQKEPQNAER